MLPAVSARAVDTGEFSPEVGYVCRAVEKRQLAGSCMDACVCVEKLRKQGAFLEVDWRLMTKREDREVTFFVLGGVG